MTLLLALHIAAGSMAILAGALALVLRKGGMWHRRAGQVFAISMLAMAGLGMVLAPLKPGMAPPQASIAVALLTVYLVTTGWLTMRASRRFDRIAMQAVLVLAVALATMGVRALLLHLLAAPYFVFAALALLAGMLDLRAIRGNGFHGAPRLRRHLWRMCVGLFFACAFFFLGQQKVMPAAWHGAPVFYLLAFAPLLAMAYWLVRSRRQITRSALPSSAIR